MTCRYDDMVELFRTRPFLVNLFHRDGELARAVRVLDVPDGGVELNLRLDTALFRARRDVIEQGLTRRERRDRLLEVVIEGVIGEFKALLGTVGP